jgi:hypothetical protein
LPKLDAGAATLGEDREDIAALAGELVALAGDEFCGLLAGRQRADALIFGGILGDGLCPRTGGDRAVIPLLEFNNGAVTGIVRGSSSHDSPLGWG